MTEWEVDPGQVAAYLAAYDAQLRVAGELARATAVERRGPLHWAEFDGRGFVTYESLESLTGTTIDDAITATVAFFRDRTSVDFVEWKTRGHDAPADLGERLAVHGFAAEDEETVMIGEAARLADVGAAPEAVTVRRAGQGGDLADDVRRALALQDEVFGRGSGSSLAAAVAEVRDHPEEVQLWLAETSGPAGSVVVGAGRLVMVPGTEFAGLWGGVSHPDWRGRGLYRALTSARARETLRLGYRYLQADCLPTSRPILQRAGLLPVTTTTPYVWTRPA